MAGLERVCVWVRAVIATLAINQANIYQFRGMPDEGSISTAHVIYRCYSFTRRKYNIFSNSIFRPTLLLGSFDTESLPPMIHHNLCSYQLDKILPGLYIYFCCCVFLLLVLFYSPSKQMLKFS